MPDKERRIQVKVGPDRWLIQDDETAGWVEMWVVQAIIAVARQIDSVDERVVVEIVRKEDDRGNLAGGFLKKITGPRGKD